MDFVIHFLSWLEFFLTNHTQFVIYENFISNNIDVISGVLQGDHLSPLLFLLLINYITIKLKHSNFLLLADNNLKLFQKISCQNYALLLQTDLNTFQKWCDENCMSLKNCPTISFSLKKEPINFDYNFKKIKIS